jgi:hypothetical protein
MVIAAIGLLVSNGGQLHFFPFVSIAKIEVHHKKRLCFADVKRPFTDFYEGHLKLCLARVCAF